MKISIIGSGYVGLVAAACFADSGNQVLCMDVDANKIALLKEGQIPIYEPGLASLVKHNQQRKRLEFTTDIQHAIQQSTLIFIAVGTPSIDNGEADLRYVFQVAQAIGQHIDDYKIVINKSTVPIGTAEQVKTIIQDELDRRHQTIEFDVVSNPEFMKEGAAIDDFLYPDRVIIGTTSHKAKKMMAELYQPFMRKHSRLISMSPRSAELTKYAANAMLATRISFMNEMANLCDRVGADIEAIREGIGSDARIGYNFLYPGIGYGGSCFPKDVKAVINTAKTHDIELHLLNAVETINQKQKVLLAEKIIKYYQTDSCVSLLKNKRFAFWGLAFKANTDDVRESSAITIINQLLNQGAAVIAYDPEAMQKTRLILNNRITYATDRYMAVKDCDALVIATEWNEFRQPDFNFLHSIIRDKVIFDGRNLYDPIRMQELGFDYICIGRNMPIY